MEWISVKPGCQRTIYPLHSETGCSRGGNGYDCSGCIARWRFGAGWRQWFPEQPPTDPQNPPNDSPAKAK